MVAVDGMAQRPVQSDAGTSATAVYAARFQTRVVCPEPPPNPGQFIPWYSSKRDVDFSRTCFGMLPGTALNVFVLRAPWPTDG